MFKRWAKNIKTQRLQGEKRKRQMTTKRKLILLHSDKTLLKIKILLETKRKKDE